MLPHPAETTVGRQRPILRRFRLGKADPLLEAWLVDDATTRPTLVELRVLKNMANPCARRIPSVDGAIASRHSVVDGAGLRWRPRPFRYSPSALGVRVHQDATSRQVPPRRKSRTGVRIRRYRPPHPRALAAASTSPILRRTGRKSKLPMRPRRRRRASLCWDRMLQPWIRRRSGDAAALLVRIPIGVMVIPKPSRLTSTRRCSSPGMRPISSRFARGGLSSLIGRLDLTT